MQISSNSAVAAWSVSLVCGRALIPAWFVTIEVSKRGLLKKPRSPRETRTFATEAEAKAFARLMLDKGLAVFAGTINPHSPKQLIPSNRVHAWLAYENSLQGEPPSDDDEKKTP